MYITILFQILKSKYFYIALILITVIGYIAFLNIRLKNKDARIEKLNNEKKELEITNSLLYKDLSFKSNQLEIKNNFTNSSIEIEKAEDAKLTDKDTAILNSIISDYYK